MHQQIFHHIRGTLAQPELTWGVTEQVTRGAADMVQFLLRYLQYRRVGFSRQAALHFAWFVGESVRAASVRLLSR
jgi:hypothetical protein